MAEIFNFYVQDNRTIQFPKNNLLEPIMQEDHNVAVWRFRIPKVLNNIDMSAWAWWFVYVNAKNQKFSELLTLTNDIDDPENYCTADYSIGYGISKTPGGFTFALEAINAEQGGEIDGEWHTRTYTHTVTPTLQGNQAEYAETESDIISELLIEVRNKVNQLVGGATPTPVASVSAMTDPSKLYLLTTDENWYYHNGTTFVSGGVYGAGVVDSVPTQGSSNAVSSGGVYEALRNTDTTLTQSGQAADAKVVGDEIANLKSTLEVTETRTPPINQWDEDWEVGGINGTTGKNGTGTNQIRSKGYIPVKSNTSYFFKLGTVVGGGNIFSYDSSKSYLGLDSLISNKGGASFTTGANTKFIRFSGGTAYGTSYNNDISINYPSTYTGYYPFTKSKIQQDFDAYVPLDHVGSGDIVREKLADSYQNTIKRLLDTGDDLNSYTKPDILYATANCSHIPDDSHSWYVQVLYIPWQNGARYTTIQIAYRQDSPKIVQTRVYDSKSSAWGSWVSNEVTDIPRSLLATTYTNTSLNLYSGDVDSKLIPDVFYSAAGNTHNPNSTENFIFTVLYAPWQNDSRQTITQIAYTIGGSCNVFYRTYQSYNTTWSEWSGISPKSVLSDKKIVFLGDSTYAIAGGDGSKIPGWVKSMTAADTYNCAFGGTRMSAGRTGDYSYFDFPNLVDSIISGDFTDQESHIPSDDSSSYTPTLARLKDVDFSEVDILCIEYGTNDFTGDIPVGTAESNKDTVFGGLVYGLDKLLTEYPNLTVLVDGIRYRAWISSGNFVDDAYTHKNALNLKMEDYAEAIETASYSVGVPYSDNLHGYGWNKYNRGTYFPSNDSTHFNSAGAKFAAKILINKLSGLGEIY